MKFRSLVAAALLAPTTGLLAQQTTPRVTKDSPAKPAAAPATAASTADLPPAQQIVDRYVAAIGGKAAVDRVQSFRFVGTFEMPAQGLKGDMEQSAARPNKVATKLTLPGVGEIVRGYDGTVGWEVSAMQGPRLIDGKELAQLQEESDFESQLLRSSPYVVSRETIGRTELGGQPCYQVKTVRKSGTASTECYSVETGLLVGGTTTRENPMGSFEATSLIEEYRDVGGIKFPTRARVKIPAIGMEQVVTISTVEFDKVDANAFARPAAVEALAKQAKP